MLVVDLWPKVCRAQGWDAKDDARRHEIYRRLHDEGIPEMPSLGRLSGVRMSEFNRRKDVDLVIAEFRALIDDTDVDALVRQIDMSRTRALHTIGTYPAEYVQSVCRDRFRGQSPEIMGESDLARLDMTLDNRNRQHAVARAVPVEAVDCPF
jgi:hypothetical protein